QPGAGPQDVGRLAVAELARGDRVQDVVDAPGPAAQVRFGDLPQLQTWYATQQLTRLGADPLGVPEVTGIVVGGRHRKRVPGRHRPCLVEELGDVPDAVGKAPGPFGIR